VSNGDVAVGEGSVRVRVASDGEHVLQFKYEAAAEQGLRWFAGPTPSPENPDQAGFFTAFYCDAWMVCDTSPAQRATLRLEIVIPEQKRSPQNLRAVGPGKRGKEWRGKGGEHFFFQQTEAGENVFVNFGGGRLDRRDRESFF